ncbi:MAG: cellulase (glycosyl hydrolase family 5) [Ruminococcus sp.]|nr:cellulase (glycosyl hydrolase family 5) [Ruminococcus sp.]
MRKLSTRIASLLLCAVMSLSAASCGGKTNDSSSEKAAEKQTEATDSSEVIDFYAPPIDIDYEGDGTAQVKVDGTKFTVSDKELWINGVNTPWNIWNDFGNSGFNYAFWEMHFAELEEAGVNASRVWINCNDMVGVILNDDGSFKEVADKHWRDLDVLFTIAKKHHIYIMATLLSFDHFKDSNGHYENWRNMIQSSDNIDSFVDGYVVPFVERYDSCDYLWSVDLMNEPDWVYENAECGQIGWEHISDYFARAAAGIHEHSDVLVTVGFGIIKYNSDMYEGNKGSDEFLQSLSGNSNSYLDFDSTHYYFWEFQYFKYPFKKGPVKFGLEGKKPAVIGEVAAYDYNESGQYIEQKYEDAYNSGWNGVMTWTSNGVDDCGDMENIAPAVARIVEIADEKVHPLK